MIKRYPTFAELADAAADTIAAIANRAIAERGRFSVALSGGNTTPPVYQQLAQRDIHWEQVYAFWADERCVPPDHPDSNYGAVHQTLLSQVPIPPENIYPMHGDIDPAQAAAEYEHQLRMFFGDVPRFDLIILGMGADGHTASLFPSTAAIHEATRWVIGHQIEKLDTWRMTLTPVVINQAAHVMFLVSGEGKAPALKQVLEGPYQPDVLPSQIVQPHDGELMWLIDAAAGALLNA